MIITFTATICWNLRDILTKESHIQEQYIRGFIDTQVRERKYLCRGDLSVIDYIRNQLDCNYNQTYEKALEEQLTKNIRLETMKSLPYYTSPVLGIILTYEKILFLGFIGLISGMIVLLFLIVIYYSCFKLVDVWNLQERVVIESSLSTSTPASTSEEGGQDRQQITNLPLPPLQSHVLRQYNPRPPSPPPSLPSTSEGQTLRRRYVV